MANNLASHLRLMLVTDDRLLSGRDPVAVARAAVRGGVTAVQLRLKQASPRLLLQLARRLREELPVPVLVNDRADVAVAAGCGVHLGPDDLPLDLARRILAPGALLGASVGTAEEAERILALGDGAAAVLEYWGVGPWRGTGTKADAGAAIGAEGLARVVRLAGGRPCIAIGGVRPEDVATILAVGAVGVAVVSGILSAADPAGAARRYSEALAAT